MTKIRPLSRLELAWANERYAEIDFAPSKESDFVAVAEVDGAKAGLGRLVPMGPGIAELGGMYVLPAYRGKSIARAIVEYLLAHASRCERLYCIPFAHLERFYTSCGFAPVGPGDAVPEAVRGKLDWCHTRYPEPVRLLVKER
jgi:GNAT superfamily N-acetyltransferase